MPVMNMSDLYNFPARPVPNFALSLINNAMKINHINLVVTDVTKAIHLFENYLGFKCIENRKNVVGFLTNEDNFVLIFWAAKLNKSDVVNYPENFHIGFYQQDEASVIRLYEAIKNEEVTFDSEPQKLRNTFGFYFYFEKLMIEISVRPS
jgi:catechol 2,3-dioxygenase-like lactoylglutathione lyase family enzyme